MVLAGFDLPPALEVYIIAAGLLILRLSIMVFMLPALGHGVVNARVRVMIVLAITAAAA